MSKLLWKIGIAHLALASIFKIRVSPIDEV